MHSNKEHKSEQSSYTCSHQLKQKNCIVSIGEKIKVNTAKKKINGTNFVEHCKNSVSIR